MARNSSGTYSRAAGPYTASTTILSASINSEMNDYGTEITDSLSRSGKGGMSAVLKGVDGAKAGPAFSFTSEATSGIYRAASNDVRLSISSNDIAQFISTGVTITGSVIANAAATNNDAVTGVGAGTGTGIKGTGGATGPGLSGVAGGAGTPARGALALTAQTAPSAPTDGDVWVTTTGLFARINSITHQLTQRTFASISYQNTSGVSTDSSSVTFTSTLAVVTGTGIWNTSTASAGMTVNTTNGTIQVTNAGTYEIKVIGHWHQTSSAGNAQIDFTLRKNASITGTPGNTVASAFSGAGFGAVSFVVTLSLAASDTIDLCVFNAAGASSTTTAFSWLNLSIDKVG